MVIRVRKELYEGRENVKFSLVRFSNATYKDENKAILKKIESYIAKGSNPEI